MTHRLLYLVRHGDSESAPDGAPHLGGLTDLGRRQAELLGERLRGVPFAAIHHSPWERAAQTAAVLSRYLPGVPVSASDMLRECVPTRPPAGMLTPQQKEWFDVLPPGTLDEGVAQAEAAMTRFGGVAPAGQHELLITHGNLIDWFVARTLDGPDWAWLRMVDYNCALTVILYLPDRVKLVAYNDAGHLPAQLRGTGYPPEARI